MASSRSQSGGSGGSALRELAASTLSVDAILELVDRLGMKDMLVNKMRSRLEEADVDAMVDDAFDYVRRNPEVLVVILGAITVSAGLIVFLESRKLREELFEDDDEDFMVMTTQSTSSKSGGSSSSSRKGSSSSSSKKSRK